MRYYSLQMEKKLKHKVLVGFKCNPSLRLELCEQSEKIGVTLSSHVETIVSTYKNRDIEVKELYDKINNLEGKVSFYEDPLLEELYKKHKGKNIAYIKRDGKKTTKAIDNIQDVFTIIINSFKTDK